ncbi:Spo0E family sporulation regulatory protein-aspartic acid phosphatase [Clostridium neonatale]|uniref:Spo0E family sporulation regulatory protein-aspartic acid phosphatase n=1 Tax=Clostridium neonatale TaxID=137838 RepID=UPI00291BB014|nr:hypothetical protein CNEO4_240018 [Clostridium neonatale]
MIDMELKTTENARNFMHKQIDKFGRDSKEALKASQDLDQKILEGMLKQDPKIENKYLRTVIKSKDIQISRLQNEIQRKEQRLRELAEIAVMYYETDLPKYRVERIIGLLKLKEGIL